jgi:response regulator RpfG family c-di-GMP phosphodiesterase
MRVTPESYFGPPSLLEQWHRKADEINVFQREKIIMLGVLDELRNYDYSTFEHSIRVGLLSADIAHIVPLPPKAVFCPGTAHDIGKTCAPEELLRKTEEWTTEDRKALASHPMDGHKIMKDYGMAVTAEIVKLHHAHQEEDFSIDNIDIPDSLKHMTGVIFMGSYVVAIADNYDAAHRNDRGGMDGQTIKDQLTAKFKDFKDLIDYLYCTGIFRIDDPRYN